MTFCKLPEVYWEDPDHVYPAPVVLSPEEFEKASQRFPKLAADTIIVDRKHKVLWLSLRVVNTMKGWWNFGGGLQMREDYAAAAKRTFARDAGLDLPLSRFKFIRYHRVISTIRQEKPQEAGEDCLVWQFALELTDEERAQVEPKPGRYVGLRAFSRADLVREPRFIALLKFYDAVFGWKARLKRAVMRFLDWLLPED